MTENGPPDQAPLDRLFVTLGSQTTAKPDLSDADGNLFSPFGV